MATAGNNGHGAGSGDHRRRRGGKMASASESDDVSDEYEINPISGTHPSNAYSLNNDGPRAVMQTYEQEAVDIDLTDPQDLLMKMEMLDLTEDETEFLIQQAYEVNKKLKEELRTESMHRTYAASAPAGTRTFSAGRGSRTSLPPINAGSTRYTFPASRLVGGVRGPSVQSNVVPSNMQTKTTGAMEYQGSPYSSSSSRQGSGRRPAAKLTMKSDKP